MNYYTLEEDQLKILIGLVEIGGVYKNARMLTSEEAASINAYPKANNVPESREGYYSVVSGYDITDGVWVTRYTYERISFDELVQLYDDAMEAHLDGEKSARGYTKREPSDYANSSVERYRQDAADWIAHRDAVMLYGLDVENKAKAGEDVPSLSEFKDGLPKIVWSFTEG